ncbi:chemotaxis protein CheC [Sutcliffiella horikoshii]|uniref:CheY-P-specific phosphatase CheC n=1 Tax=Sutcliffiella horikoshii TaxID=79883 RepID=A0A1Y0CN81_9BACI|nr:MULTISPECIES: chemotaxis protein CheC [Bacillaceae]ART76367.1 CheY-P-specific phosphatase CheC [Sutcliffiella horikoshii]TYS61629.1 chemotaxis protein CheC [Sutcliffiella horikoshii]
MNNEDKLNELDLLKELGNIGAGNAATALSQLLNKEIHMNVPLAKIVSFNEMMDLMGGSDRPVAAVFLRMEGELSGSLFFVLSLDDATKLINQLIPEKKISVEELPSHELGLSALQELGNIISAHYLTALSECIGLAVTPSVPQVTIDMVGAIVVTGLLEISQVSDHSIFIDTELTETTDNQIEKTKGHFFLIPYPDSFEKILAALGEK